MIDPRPTPPREQRVLRALLLGLAATLPLSIALAETFTYTALIVWAYGLARGWARPSLRTPYLAPILAFGLLSAVSYGWSIRPEVTLGRVYRLSMWLTVPAWAAAFDGNGLSGWRKAALPAACLALGVVALGLHDLVRVPIEVARGTALFDTGNMRDPQFFMVGMALLWGAGPALFRVAFADRRGLAARAAWLWRIALLLSILGLVLHFKRGVWLSCGMTLLGMSLWAGQYRRVLAIALCATALLLLPQARERLDGLRGEELSLRTGGRMTLWTQVAPNALRRFPHGVGYGAVRHEDFGAWYDGYIQPDLNHLHNNLLEVTLETGRVGAGLWLAWMGLTLFLLGRDARRRAADPDRGLALGAFGAFVGLMLNGLVEYNFGDSEILLLMAVLMGLSAMAGTGAETAHGARRERTGRP